MLVRRRSLRCKKSANRKQMVGPPDAQPGHARTQHAARSPRSRFAHAHHGQPSSMRTARRDRDRDEFRAREPPALCARKKHPVHPITALLSQSRARDPPAARSMHTCSRATPAPSVLARRGPKFHPHPARQGYGKVSQAHSVLLETTSDRTKTTIRPPADAHLTARDLRSTES